MAVAELLRIQIRWNCNHVQIEWEKFNVFVYVYLFLFLLKSIFIQEYPV